ncbi:hypothetical protein [Frankia tisae]|uniref:hypothetical protein n=1 Tax=Frankia tisae TaxID=2950104 RepID=UPI0021BFCD18|nr:hypothetical protein [Frankia tisae]
MASSGVALLVVLHPPKVESDALVFETYLHNLTVTAYQVDFANPDTLPASPPHTVVGSATYKAVNDPENTIFQLTNGLGTKLYSAAVAVIDVDPAVVAKYTSPTSLVNVVLSVTRGGDSLREHTLDYDVQLWGSTGTPYAVPIVSALGVNAIPLALDGTPAGGVVGLYLPLPDPAFDAGTGTAYLLPPADGSAPRFQDIKAAVNTILKEDPTGLADPPDLTPVQSLHIARELVSNRYAAPLPTPPSEVQDLYTTGKDDDRKHFESTLQSYYATLDAEASRLAGFIYAWSAALNCNGLTKDAPEAALTFPVRVSTMPGVSQSAVAGVVLHN